jgi:hypothetical protein
MTERRGSGSTRFCRPRSNATGQDECLAVFTALLRDGSLFYAFGVSPGGRFSDDEGAFRRVGGSIQMMEGDRCLARRLSVSR